MVQHCLLLIFGESVLNFTENKLRVSIYQIAHILKCSHIIACYFSKVSMSKWVRSVICSIMGRKGHNGSFSLKNNQSVVKTGRKR